jgi:endonuclease YncB( thermonuclease family)
VHLALKALLALGIAAPQSVAAQDRSPQSIAADWTAPVVSTRDGDTFVVLDRRGKSTVIRLEGVDCPEPGQPFSRAATNLTRQLVLNRDVHLRVLSTDRAGRLIARVTVEGKDVSLELVKAGLAWHYTDFSSDRLLESAEKEARAVRRGIWSEPSPVPPWVARRPPPQRAAAPAESAGPLHGNVNSRLYHRRSCQNYNCKNCTAVFPTEAEARAAGFRPAGDCFRLSP